MTKELSIKAKETKRLWLYVAIVLGLPAVVSQFVPTKRHFDAEPIAALKTKRPDVVQRVPWFAKVAITFALTCAGWLLFRERNLHQIALDLAQSPFAAPIDHWQIGIYLVLLVLFYSLPLVVHMVGTGIVAPRWNLEKWLPDKRRFAFETSIAVFLFLGILVARSVTRSDFIYFQSSEPLGRLGSIATTCQEWGMRRAMD